MNTYDENVYVAEIVRWVDGDTVELRVDLGQKVTVTDHYRLARVDAPETVKRKGVTDGEKEAGLALKERINDLWPKGTRINIQTLKDTGRYGRYIAEVFVKDLKGLEINLSDWLLDSGWAKPYGS
jgi:micrococcal nuclease